MRWVWISLAVLGALLITAFTIQNSRFGVPLQLDLYFFGWKLARPASVPALMWISFGVGGALGAGALWLRSSRLNTRIKQLEREIAMGGARTRDPWGGA